MRNLLTSLIISFAVMATASTSYAGDDREDREWDRDKKEQHHHGKKERHRKGGLPVCKAELAECVINLTETENWLQACQDELTQCQATESQAFPATGQVTCWDSSWPANEIPCAGTGQDGDIQAGATLSYTDTGLTIIDNNTKLEWIKQDDNDSLGISTGWFIHCDPGSYPGNLDKDCIFTWDGAFTFVATLNANNHAGHADWRVPNVKELQSTVNYENYDPAVSAEFHTGCVAGCVVADCSCTVPISWSSTSHANFDGVWVVNFQDAGVYAIGSKEDASERVRAVRGGLID